MFILSKKDQVCSNNLVPGSCSIRGSFSDGRIVYQLIGVSTIHLKPIIISSFPTLDEAKEAKTQLDLAMDNYPVS